MNLKELSFLLKSEELQINCKLDEEKNRLYLAIQEKFTIYLELIDNVIFVRVWRSWEKSNPIEKQNIQTLNVCKVMKYKILKKLHSINETIADKTINLEEMPNSMESIRLNPKDVKQKSILDLDI